MARWPTGASSSRCDTPAPSSHGALQYADGNQPTTPDELSRPSHQSFGSPCCSTSISSPAAKASWPCIAEWWSKTHST